MQINLENTTKKLCVIGDPVLHSKSPLLHNTMLRALGLDYVYLCQPVPRGRLADWVYAAMVADYAGFNATMPHKEALVPMMDELDGDARLCGAVNTVAIRDGRLLGYNTDGAGFAAMLARKGVPVAGREIVLLGAGGAAKSVALKLAGIGAKRVTVLNRTLEKAESIREKAPQVIAAAGFTPDILRERAGHAEILINCTSLGMEDTAGQFEEFSFLEHLPSEAVVCDLIYHPAETRLLAEAKARGHLALNGLGMLVHQAILALEHMTGVRLDAAAMANLLEGTLR
ncbi:MAG: Shikimate 5-dehydrogenase alpha [Oscillospiraceae bacterium]|nr:Shikimate 5-dehydrogenase alpha [Oscillospiraceae bacterium]